MLEGKHMKIRSFRRRSTINLSFRQSIWRDSQKEFYDGRISQQSHTIDWHVLL